MLHLHIHGFGYIFELRILDYHGLQGLLAKQTPSGIILVDTKRDKLRTQEQ